MSENQISKLKESGIAPKDVEIDEAYLCSIEKFLKSFLFMRLGQAITRKNWQGAMIICRQMSTQIEDLNLQSMNRQMSSLRIAVAQKNSIQAKNILALLVAKRVQLLKIFQ